MTKQLKLIDTTEIDWKLDERTKEIGRRGLALARAALRAAAALPAGHDDHDGRGHHEATAA